MTSSPRATSTAPLKAFGTASSLIMVSISSASGEVSGLNAVGGTAVSVSGTAVSVGGTAVSAGSSVAWATVGSATVAAVPPQVARNRSKNDSAHTTTAVLTLQRPFPRFSSDDILGSPLGVPATHALLRPSPARPLTHATNTHAQISKGSRGAAPGAATRQRTNGRALSATAVSPATSTRHMQFSPGVQVVENSPLAPNRSAVGSPSSAHKPLAPD